MCALAQVSINMHSDDMKMYTRIHTHDLKRKRSFRNHMSMFGVVISVAVDRGVVVSCCFNFSS